MDDDKSSNMDQIRMGSLTGVFASIVAPARGSGAAAEQQLPRTRQDVVAEAPVFNPPVAPINMPAIEDRGLPLSAENLYDDALDEPHEKQQDSGKPQDRKTDLPADSPNQEDEEWPLKWPIAPQYCRRWGKPDPYVISYISATLSDGM